ncbi:type II CAAX prenyl endopeptidase Rce1 family protein [Aneurinibacillus migulanus]|uniref:CPBP family glutamic-type intramembrane protease n=1 Tax=Aneurinibacillus migulanus TaxID=47500 RepID=UPI003B97B7D7
MLILKISLSFIYYTVTYSVGEEIGWRGYLLSKLMGLGWINFPLLTAAVVLGGIVNRRENIIQ